MGNNLRHLTNKYVYTCLIVISFFVLALHTKTEIRYVNNLKDFKTHTSNHIQNVYRLGMYLYYQNKDTLFQDIPEAVIKEKLLKHDYEKFASLEDLQRFGYDKKNIFVERLYGFYGKKQTEDSKLSALVVELNDYAARYDNLFFRKYGYLDKNGKPKIIAMKISLIEKIADIVEREKNPITSEELGIPRTKKSNIFFTNALEKKLADNLANNYIQIVPPNPLIYISTLNHHTFNQHVSCRFLFN